MTVLTDVIQAGGYFPDPLGMTPAPPCPPPAPTRWDRRFTGTQAAGQPDQHGVRYRTPKRRVILCDGSSQHRRPPGEQLYTNVFTVVPPAGAVPGEAAMHGYDRRPPPTPR